jgi:hypothetical protein
MPILVNPIINCEFEYECDLDWDLLNKTNDPMVNYCDQCKKEVKLCLSNEEIDRDSSSQEVIKASSISPSILLVRPFDGGIRLIPLIGLLMGISQSPESI